MPVGGTPAGLKLSADKTILKSADGTDDAQIIVTVVDAGGKALSNSPPVTLAIESGPGEFPTGPAIAFAPDSDISIRDGQAAMEFRSYYSGQTVIRATSPGLKDTTLAITTLGEPKFIAGKTPAVKARPYVRFDGAAVKSSAAAIRSRFQELFPTVPASRRRSPSTAREPTSFRRRTLMARRRAAPARP
jgi:hypothetical protein